MVRTNLLVFTSHDDDDARVQGHRSLLNKELTHLCLFAPTIYCHPRLVSARNYCTGRRRRKHSCWLSRRLMLLEESGGVNARSRGDTVPPALPAAPPPLPRRRCELPGVGPDCLGSRGQSRGASGAGLCESLLKRFTMDLIYSDLELLCVMGSTCLASTQSTHGGKKNKDLARKTSGRSGETQREN